MEYQKSTPEELRNKLSITQRRMIDHVNNEHVGASKGKINRQCHDCMNISQRILNLESLMRLRKLL